MIYDNIEKGTGNILSASGRQEMPDTKGQIPPGPSLFFQKFICFQDLRT